MSLYIVSTPIGNPEDITLRALNILKKADVVIGEERKVASKLLRQYEISGKQLELLNEHSSPEDVQELVNLCLEKEVALISDCGTPGFCDPGPKLIHLCRQKNISIIPVPGASSLLALFAVSSQSISEFVFKGFLPANTELRQQALLELKSEKRALILMDTPYRLHKLLNELKATCPERKALIGLNLTQPEEQFFEGRVKDLPDLVKEQKAEFVLMLYATQSSSTSFAKKKR